MYATIHAWWLHVASTWTDRAMQATTYRKGRVLLAGDAAHIHSPLGGQGLNLGFGDAMNLGWKLAATIRGDAPDGLLDSYTTERHPVGARILDWSRAQVALMQSNALQAIVRDLIETRDGATYFAERLWGVSLRYDLGDGHPLVGRSCPDFELEDGTRLGVLLRDGKGVLLDFHPRLAAPIAREPPGRAVEVHRVRGQGPSGADGRARPPGRFRRVGMRRRPRSCRSLSGRVPLVCSAVRSIPAHLRQQSNERLVSGGNRDGRQRSMPLSGPGVRG